MAVKQKKERKRLKTIGRGRMIFLILWILATVFIFTNSMQVAEVSSEKSGKIVFLLEKLCSLLNLESTENLTFYVRKGAHMFEFFLQSCMLSGFFILGGKRYTERVIYVLFAGLFTACVDEFIQLFFDGRSGMIQDVFVDFTGVFAGAAVGLILWRFRQKKR